MTRLRCVVLAGLGVWPAAGLVAASGCSSNSSPAAASKGGADGSVEAATGGIGAGGIGSDGGAEGGGDGGVSLTWSAIVYSAAFFAGPTGDGGASGDAEAPSGDDGGEGGAPPVPGAEICVLPQGGPVPPAPSGDATGNCATTAADGTFVIPSVPIRTNLVLTVKKAGFIPGLLSITSASTPMDGRSDPIPMFPLSIETYPAIPVTVDWQNKGQITAFALGPGGGLNFSGEPGSVLSMSPMSGDGPVYVDQNGNNVLSASAMIDNHANFYNVDPGTYTVTISDSTDDCEPISVFFAGYGFPVVTPLHSLQVVVAAGYWSGLVGFLCTTKSTIVGVDGG